MYENEILNDFCKRCGGKATIGVLGAQEEDKNAITNMLEPYSDLNVKVLEDVALAKDCNAVLLLTSLSDDDKDFKVDINVVSALNKLGIPFIIIANCISETSDSWRIYEGQLQEKFGVCAVCLNLLSEKEKHIDKIFKELLFEFPITSFDVKIPEWMQFLPKESSAISELIERVKAVAEKIYKIKDCSAFDNMLQDCNYWQSEILVNITPEIGKAEISAYSKEGVFYDMLSEIAGEKIIDESGLMGYIKGASEAKRGFDKVKDALECAKVNGYGIVQPDDSDMSLESPQVVRHGGSVGIKLKATAPSYHIIKVDVSGEASPIMGSASESEQIVKGMMAGFESNPEEMWDTNVFGKSLKSMVKDGLSGKVTCMQNDTKVKMRRAITRIINEGKGGVICILL